MAYEDYKEKLYEDLNVSPYDEWKAEMYFEWYKDEMKNNRYNSTPQAKEQMETYKGRLKTIPKVRKMVDKMLEIYEKS